MGFEISITSVRYISELSDGDVKASIKGDMVNRKATQIIAPQFSKDGLGHMVVWIDDEA